MVHVSELLRSDLGRPVPRSLSTGFAEVDALTGGLMPGQLLVISSPPGHGKTTLATQLAGAAAVAGRSVRLHCPRESPTACAARLVASVGRVPYRPLLNGRPLGSAEEKRAELTRLRLAQSKLDVVTGPSVLDLDTVAGGDVIVVDDAHLGNAGGIDGLRQLCHAGAVVIATVPEDLTCENGIGPHPRLRRQWAEISDLMIGIAWPGPDLATQRTGQADLYVMKNRHGPLMQEIIAFQGSYARFDDLASDAGS